MRGLKVLVAASVALVVAVGQPERVGASAPQAEKEEEQVAVVAAVVLAQTVKETKQTLGWAEAVLVEAGSRILILASQHSLSLDRAAVCRWPATHFSPRGGSDFEKALEMILGMTNPPSPIAYGRDGVQSPATQRYPAPLLLHSPRRLHLSVPCRRQAGARVAWLAAPPLEAHAACLQPAVLRWSESQPSVRCLGPHLRRAARAW
jgi:hypothetical protein